MIKTLLSQETIASKEWVYNQFNSNSNQQTLKGPGSGAAVVQINDQDKAIAITTDSNSRYIYLDPEIGGQIAVAEAARNLVVSGAKRSEEHTSELQSRGHLVCRLLLEKKKKTNI